MSRSRRVLIIVLIAITVLLAGVSIYITVRLQQTQAPPDTSAACVLQASHACVGGSGSGCWCNENNISATCNQGPCNSGWCESISCTPKPAGTTGGGTTGGGTTGGTDCATKYSGQFSADSYTCFTIPAGCPSKTGAKYTQSKPNATGNGDCVGTSTNKQTMTFGPGTYCATSGASCGTCVQYDLDGGGGVAGFTGACPVTKVNCGKACNATSDCNQPGGGVTVVCDPTSKMCVNSACPTNYNATAACGCKPTTESAGPVVTASCPTGSVTPTLTITWTTTTARGAQGYNVNISRPGITGSWKKNITDPNTLTTTAPTGFTPQSGATGDLQLIDGQTYTVSISYTATNENSSETSVTVSGCSVTIPETGIIDENPYVFFGIFMIVIGYLTYKLRLTYLDRNNLLINGFFEFKESAVKTSRRGYEEKLEKKLRRKLENK